MNQRSSDINHRAKIYFKIDLKELQNLKSTLTIN